MSEWKTSACILCECNCGIQVQLGGVGRRRLQAAEEQLVREVVLRDELGEHLGAVRLHQVEAGVADLSGAALVGGRLFLGDDEGHRLLQCAPDPAADGWLQQGSIALGREGEEIDIEALDYADGHLYVAGSHSLRRKALKPEKFSAARNRKRFRRIEMQEARKGLDEQRAALTEQMRVAEKQIDEVETARDDEGKTLVTFTDNGPGMSEEKAAQVFEPFFTDKTKGTGLGLAITKNIVEEHGGEIRGESRAQEGTRFVISFP